MPVAFLQTSRELRSNPHTVTLVDLTPVTVCVRSGQAGEAIDRLATSDFLERWERCSGGRPVSARICLADPEAALSGEAALRIARPRVFGGSICFDVEVMSGVLPAESGACLLVIEPDEEKWAIPVHPDRMSRLRARTDGMGADEEDT
jgi:hypothetical protein